TIDPKSVTKLKIEDHFEIAEFDAEISNFTSPRFGEELFEPITHILAGAGKSFKIMLNKWDEPRLVQADHGGRIDMYDSMDDIFKASSCFRERFDEVRTDANSWDKFDWITGSKTLREQHGFLMMPDSFGTRNVFAPIFSQAKIDCHLDIIMPLEYHLEVTAVPVYDPYSWAEKKNVLFWRGTTTGGSFKNGAPWEKYPRMKMMDWERQFSKKYGHKYKGVTFDAGKGEEPPNKELSVDIGLSAVVQTDEVTTEIIRNRYPLKKKVTFEQTKQFKYLIVVDGNTWPSRLQAYLQTNSVVLYAGIFTDFYNWKLQPWIHFVPIRLDFSDLDEKLKWLMDNDDAARQISENAQKLVRRMAGRRRHIHCYTSLLTKRDLDCTETPRVPSKAVAKAPPSPEPEVFLTLDEEDDEDASKEQVVHEEATEDKEATKDATKDKEAAKDKDEAVPAVVAVTPPPAMRRLSAAAAAATPPPRPVVARKESIERVCVQSFMDKYTIPHVKSLRVKVPKIEKPMLGHHVQVAKMEMANELTVAANALHLCFNNCLRSLTTLAHLAVPDVLAALDKNPTLKVWILVFAGLGVIPLGVFITCMVFGVVASWIVAGVSLAFFQTGLVSIGLLILVPVEIGVVMVASAVAVAVSQTKLWTLLPTLDPRRGDLVLSKKQKMD
ncbi:capsule-associated protein CAP1, partial [Podochytrium sp. JEL0797]